MRTPLRGLAAAAVLWPLALGVTAQADEPATLAEVGRALAQSPTAAFAALDRLPPQLAASAEARYLRARAEAVRGEHDATVRALEGLESALPLLTEDIVRRRADALAFGGRMRDAESTYRALATRLHAAEREVVLARAAECALAAGDAARAAPALRAALESDPRGLDPMATSMALAEAELAQGRRAEAALALRRAVVRWP
ncbi:MAG: hypothetical protein IT379_16975, partial [Deltaproteobacteria bacterium]|nr:hypothetical protein [Deltaproteobacteria bacterium]